ncbi:UNVERIFIED_CONTAM: hypothetical protein FKN15_028617 [Acipenser sinensis]
MRIRVRKPLKEKVLVGVPKRQLQTRVDKEEIIRKLEVRSLLLPCRKLETIGYR